MMGRNVAGSAILVLAVLFGLAPLVRGAVDLPVAQHHLLHSVLILGAVASALCFATPSRDTTGGRYGWLLLTVISPLVAMLLMWPSEYAWFERNPNAHALQHLALITLGFLSAFAGQRYVAGVGWASGLSLLFMAVGSTWGFGVAP